MIEIDADELESASVGAGNLADSLGIDAYVGVTIGSPSAVDLACVIVALEGSRLCERREFDCNHGITAFTAAYFAR